MTNLIEVHTDISVCQELYMQLSDHRSWFDNWDLRWVYNQAYDSNPLHFLTYSEDEIVKALLPLQFNKEKQVLEFFGGRFFELNHGFGVTNLVAQLFISIQQPAFIDGLAEPPAEVLPYMFPSEAGPKYVLNLTDFSTEEEFLAKFSSGFRKNRRREFRNLDELNITIVRGDSSDAQTMIEFNMERFGEESSYHNRSWREGFLNMVKLPYDWHIRKFMIGDEVIGIQVANLDGSIYISHNKGSKIRNYIGLGWYMTLKNIMYAKSLGATHIESGTGDMGWKIDWHHTPIAQYTLKID